MFGKWLYRVAAKCKERLHFIDWVSDVVMAINLSNNWNLILLHMVNYHRD